MLVCQVLCLFRSRLLFFPVELLYGTKIFSRFPFITIRLVPVTFQLLYCIVCFIKEIVPYLLKILYHKDELLLTCLEAGLWLIF